MYPLRISTIKFGLIFALLPVAAPAASQTAATTASHQGVQPRARGDSSGIPEILHELYLGNLPAHRIQAQPSPWLHVPTDIYTIQGKRLQFHHYPTVAAASDAKDALLKRLRTPQTSLTEPDYVTRCGSIVALEFGGGDAVIGAADQTCEHPINIPAYVKIERDRDAAKLLRLLARHGSPRQAFDVWSPFFERGPGFAYAIPSGYLYVHVSPTSAEAERARQQWADQTQNEFPQNRQWAHRCGRAMVVYDQRQGRGMNALLQRQCGAAVIGRAVVRD